MAACSGNVLWTLVGNTYVGTISNTTIVVSCIGGGVLGFILTATFGGNSTSYAIDPSSTCIPFDLLFTDVLTDCGVIDIEIKGDLSKCIPSSSSSSLSVNPSSSSQSAGSGIPGCFCPNMPANLVLTVVNDCPGATSPNPIIYNAAGSFGSGWYTSTESLGGKSLQWFMPCINSDGNVQIFQVVNGSEVTSATDQVMSCSPFDSGDIVLASTSPCGLSAIVRVTI